VVGDRRVATNPTSLCPSPPAMVETLHYMFLVLQVCGSGPAPLSSTSWMDLLRGFVWTDELREERVHMVRSNRYLTYG
jgi:hypothetical protein